MFLPEKLLKSTKVKHHFCIDQFLADLRQNSVLSQLVIFIIRKYTENVKF